MLSKMISKKKKMKLFIQTTTEQVLAPKLSFSFFNTFLNTIPISACNSSLQFFALQSPIMFILA